MRLVVIVVAVILSLGNTQAKIPCHVVNCFADPCQVNPIHEKCREFFPDATCVSNYCGGCNFFWYETSAKLKPLKCPQGCTEDAKLCPDGTVVGRNSYNNCEFDPCPKLVRCTHIAKLCPDGSKAPRDNKCVFLPCPDVVIGCPRVPKVKRKCPSPPIPNGCNRNGDCKGKAKCCKVPCERFVCIVSKPKPGVCPPVTGGPSALDCVRQGDIRCGVDNDCDNAQKCCGTPCNGTKCTDPVICYPKRKDATWADGQCQCRKKKHCKGKWRKCKKGKKMCPKKHVCCCPQDYWNKDCGGKM